MRYVPEHRRTNYKDKGKFNTSLLKTRRDDQSVEIRKTNRLKKATIRRNLGNFDNSSDEEEFDEDDQLDAAAKVQRNKSLLSSNNKSLRLKGAVGIRQLVSRKNNPPLKEVIDSGTVPILLGLLSQSDSEIQLEAAWALINLASDSDSTKCLVEAGAIPQFINALQTDNLRLIDQIIWALGNIAGESAEYRQLVLHHGVMPLVISILEQAAYTPLLRTAAWALSNLCRGRDPYPSWKIISTAIPTLSRLLHSDEPELVVEACNTISSLTEFGTHRVNAIIAANIPRKLVQLLDSGLVAQQIPSLRSIGNIVTGTAEQTQHIINCDPFPSLLRLLRSPVDKLRKEACWTLSNIAAGTPEQSQAVIDNNIIPPVVHLMATSDFRTRKEACWVICNIVTAGPAPRPELVKYLVRQGCIAPLCSMLRMGDNTISMTVLDTLDRILLAGGQPKYNPYSEFIEESGGLELITECQTSPNISIYEKAYAIVDTYFSDNDNNQIDDNIAPLKVHGDIYGFGVR